MIDSIRLGLLLAVAGLLAACVGGGTDTESGGPKVSGKIVTAGGDAAVGVRTYLVPSSFNPVARNSVPASLIDTTDGEGRYSFSPGPGEYNLEAISENGGTGLFQSGIVVGSGSVEVLTDTLKHSGTLTVSLSGLKGSKGGFVYLTGTTLKKEFAEDDPDVILDSVPVATYKDISYAQSDSSVPVILYKNVSVDSM